MDNLVIKNVDVMGDTIMAAKDNNGEVWVGIRWICDGLGMTEGHMKRQIKNIKKDLALSQGGSNLTLNKGSGEREVFCIKLDYLPIWLAKISITPTIQRDHPELAKKLLEYQLKAKDILAAAFLPKRETAGDVQGQIKLLAQGTTELYQRMDGLEERFQKLESDIPIFNVDAKNIQDAVRKRAIEILGGKDSNAYRDRSVRGYVFADIQCMLRRNFDVKRYEEIKHKRVDDAIRLIREHKPLLVIQDKVDMANAQMRMEL